MAPLPALGGGSSAYELRFRRRGRVPPPIEAGWNTGDGRILRVGFPLLQDPALCLLDQFIVSRLCVGPAAGCVGAHQADRELVLL